MTRSSGRSRTLKGALLVIVLVSFFLAGFLPALSPARARATEGDGLPVIIDGTYIILEVYNLLYNNSISKPEPGILAEYAIRGMLSGLRDYHGAYYDPAQMKAFLSDVQGTFGGIGVRIMEDDEGYLIVADVLPGFPGEKAGLEPGDRIVAVDGHDIAGEGLQAGNRIRGEPGTAVVLTIRRDGHDEPLEFEIVRALITTSSVDYEMLDARTGYIRIMSFDHDTDEEFDAALQSLVASGAQAFVIDLRNNPGGFLDVCVRIAERLVPPRHHIAQIRWTWRSEVIRSRMGDYTPLAGIPYLPDGRFPYPIAVLVNNHSASASEILAACLKDWGIARIFGERTYGKGSVQSLYTLSHGGGVKITTATWRSGLGTEIERVGITPHEIIPGPSTGFSDPLFVPVASRWVFRRGAMGTDIIILQSRLNQLGYDAGEENGIFGAKTETALKRFQAAVGVPQTGITDAATVNALNRARLADHPAGQVTGPDGRPFKPTWPEVTGDHQLDRSLQWLGEQLAGG